MNSLSSQRPLDRCPPEIQFMVLVYLPGRAVRDFLYTCKDYFVHFIWYFITRRTDNGLIYAARHKDRHLLRIILSIDDVEINREDECGETALCAAVRQSDQVMVRTLATYPNIDTQKPLRYAVENSELKMADLVLRSGNAKLDATDCFGRTILHYAVMNGGPEIAELFAMQAQSSDLEKFDKEGKTPLHWAIQYGYDEIMDIYFWGRQARRFLGTDLLLWAIRHQREILALEILRLPGLQLVVNSQRDNPLHLALQEGLDLVVEELKIIGAGFTDDENHNAIRPVSTTENVAITSRLLDSGVTLPGDEFVLWGLARGADYDIFRLFVLHGSYGPVFHNDTCLKNAIPEGEMKVIRKILRMTTGIDHDAVLTAVKSDRPEVLLTVLEHSRRHSANIMSHDNLGELLVHAIQHDAISVLKMLLRDLHVDPCYTKRGQAALSYAAKRGRTDVISCLLRCHKVTPNLPDADGQIPLDHILSGRKPDRDTFRQNLKLLALDSRTTPSSFDDGGKNMLKSLRRAHQYWLLAALRERGFEDKDYWKSKATRISTPDRTYNFKSRHARYREL